MSATQRFTGSANTITFSAQTVSNDYTELTIDLSMNTEERTAGADTDASFNTTYKEGKASLKIFGTGESNVAVEQALRVGTSSSLSVYPKGNTTGKPIIAFPAIVTTFKETIGFNKNVVIEVEFLKNGAVTSDIGTVV